MNLIYSGEISGGRNEVSKLVYIDEPVPVEIEVHSDESTLLQISNKHGIHHLQECGGRGQCTTCRIAILSGEGNVTPRNKFEQRLAFSRGWGNQIRLACQTKLLGDVTAKRVFRPLDHDYKIPPREKSVVVLVCDVRSFTEISAKQLPFDVVHILNEYFEGICEPFLAYGGYIDKYMGDGLLGFFGIDQEGPSFVSDAVKCAVEMVEKAKRLNNDFRSLFNLELRIGLSLHYGKVILGEIGHHSKRQLTAIGDVVNVASKVEDYNRLLGTTLLISDQLYQFVKEEVAINRSFHLDLVGKQDPQVVHEVLEGGLQSNFHG